MARGVWTTHRVIDQRSPSALPGDRKYVYIPIDQGSGLTPQASIQRSRLLAPIRRRILIRASWPAFVERTHSPRYVHSKLSRASDDSERSSVMMPAERSADSSLGTIPKLATKIKQMYERRFRAAAGGGAYQRASFRRLVNV